jgi:hypothetical protein
MQMSKVNHPEGMGAEYRGANLQIDNIKLKITAL